MIYYVVCKNCSARIPVSSKGGEMLNLGTGEMRIGPGGSVKTTGVSFGPGGKITFGPGGKLEFGPPPPSEFKCRECGHISVYLPSEIVEDDS